MLRFHGTCDVARDAVRSIAARDVDNIATGTATATETQEGTSTGVISTPRAADTTSRALTQDPTATTTQIPWPWHRGSPDGNPWTGQWGGIPTTIITLASTVTYTEPPSTAQLSQISTSIPKPPEDRKEGMGISGPVAAGIGIGASVGLLGLCLVVAYLFRRRSRRQGRQSSSLQKSEGIKTGDGIWPTYPYSASNEAPIELSASRPTKELDAATKHRQQDLSFNLGLVELDGSNVSGSKNWDDALRGI
ncbi:hypothetical protein NPX13_g3925 [Xylaria arbuscula]|uniref:Uncharacterized protein n=1 Tax=Xylaria arbuscula TaxID=114810 RepID=A0A9W8NHT7_9PEZI|nr:hypothetical protein NPX13_g3925 [Xylaria arbuscula]